MQMALNLTGTGAGGGRPRGGSARPRPESWAERWRGVSIGLERIPSPHPLIDAVIDGVDHRMIRVGDRWLADFASSNYLGFDLDNEIIEAVPDYLRRWGSRSGSSRMPGLRRQYEEIEQHLTSLLRCEDTLVVPADAEIHAMIIPALVDGGTIFLDRRAQKSIVDGCAAAQAGGATVVTCLRSRRQRATRRRATRVAPDHRPRPRRTRRARDPHAKHERLRSPSASESPARIGRQRATR